MIPKITPEIINIYDSKGFIIKRDINFKGICEDNLIDVLLKNTLDIISIP